MIKIASLFLQAEKLKFKTDIQHLKNKIMSICN